MKDRKWKLKKKIEIGKKVGWKRVRIDEDIEMVEGGKENDMIGKKNEIEEKVERNVEKEEKSERIDMDINVELEEMKIKGLKREERGNENEIVVVKGGKEG